MFKSLRAQLLASILVPLLVIVPIVAWLLIYLLQTQVILGSIANELIRQAVLVADVSATTLEIWQDPTQAQAFVARLSPRLSAKLMLLDPTGHLIVSSDPNDATLVGKAYEMPDLQKLLAQETPVQVNYNKNSQIEDVIVPVVTASGRLIGYVRLTNPLASLYSRSAQLGRIALFVAAGGILGGILLGWLLSRSLERPLKKTSQAVYSLANGQQPLSPLNEEGPEEVKVLVRSFNTLMEKLQTSEEARKRLLANTVHELGRPLGALLSALQALLSGADEQTELRKELLQGMEGEVVLLHLLDDLAHLEQGTSALILHRQSVQVSEWLPMLLATWSEAAQEKKLTWEQEIAPGLPPANFDPERIAQALGNLLSNAIRYTPSGGKVKVSALQEDHTLEFVVQDSGPGISPEEQENIFQPLYRGKAAKRFSEGMGLGLPIARDLVEAHNGSISVQSMPGQGSQFKVSLPLE
jgi:two-component system sensor histidine kinase BaeS